MSQKLKFYNFRNQTAESVDLYIFGVIGWDVYGADFVRELKAVTAPAVNVYISSIGGDVSQAVEIFNALCALDKKKVAILSGWVASAATYISCAFPTVKAYDNCFFMIHECLGYVDGNADEHEEATALLRKVDDMLASAYVSKTGRDEKEIRDWMKAETTFTAAEAKERGFIDEILTDKSQARAVALATVDAIQAAGASTINKGKTMSQENKAVKAELTEEQKARKEELAAQKAELEKQLAEINTELSQLEEAEAPADEANSEADKAGADPAAAAQAKAENRKRIAATADKYKANAEVQTLAVQALASDEGHEAFLEKAIEVVAKSANAANRAAVRAAVAPAAKTESDKPLSTKEIRAEYAKLSEDKTPEGKQTRQAFFAKHKNSLLG